MTQDTLGLAKSLTDALIVLDVERSESDRKIQEAKAQREKHEAEIERLRKQEMKDRSEIHCLRQDLDLMIAQKEIIRKDLEIAQQFAACFDTAMLEAARLGALMYHADFLIPTTLQLNRLKQDHANVIHSLRKQKQETMIAKQTLEKFNDEKFSESDTLLRSMNGFRSGVDLLIERCKAQKS